MSRARVYKLQSQDSKLRHIMETDRQIDGRAYRYGENVLRYLLEHYPAQKPSSGSEMASEAMQLRQETESLREQIRTLEAERDALKTQLEAKTERCAELEADKGQLFRALADAQAGWKEMRAQMQALLPAPRKTLRERIAAAFGRKSQDTEGDKE